MGEGKDNHYFSVQDGRLCYFGIVKLFDHDLNKSGKLVFASFCLFVIAKLFRQFWEPNLASIIGLFFIITLSWGMIDLNLRLKNFFYKINKIKSKGKKRR